MKFTLFSVNHYFLVDSNKIEAILAIESDSFQERETGQITVIIEHPQPKSLTLSEIEQLAITKALNVLK